MFRPIGINNKRKAPTARTIIVAASAAMIGGLVLGVGGVISDTSEPMNVTVTYTAPDGASSSPSYSSEAPSASIAGYKHTN